MSVTDFKSSKLKSSKRVDASIARCPCCTPCHETGRNILFLALSPSHPFFDACQVYLLFSLSLYFVSLFFLFPFFSTILGRAGSVGACAFPLFSFFYLQSDSTTRSASYNNGDSVGEWLACARSCSISVSGLRRSHISNYDRHRSRQHFKRRAFEPCIFIPLNKQFYYLVEAGSSPLVFYTQYGSLFFSRENAQP